MDLNIKQQKKYERVICEFNNTNKPYKKDTPINKFLELCANKSPDAKVLFYKNRKLTFTQLNVSANRVANLLLNNKTKKEEIIAILMDRTPEMLSSIFGIMKAGGAYLPIDSKWPKKRILEVLNDAKTKKIIIDKKHLELTEDLLWESKYLNGYVCVDSNPKVNLNLVAHGAKQRDLWNYVASGKKGDYIDAAGWKSSYSNKNFSKEEINELVNNVYFKLKSYLNKNKNILEVGCGSGLILEKLARYVNSYHGTDISENVIKLAKRKVKSRGLNNVNLEVLSSDNISKLKSNNYDIIIVNSVIQFFPNYFYLNNFLRQASKLLKNDGVLFIGDVRDKDKQIIFYKSLVKFKKDKKFVTNKCNSEKELFIPKKYFKDVIRYTSISDVEIDSKIGKIKNELSLYRYDVLMYKYDKPANNKNVIKHRLYKENIDKQIIKNPNIHIEGSNLAYVIYTSGSTGKPKGVMIEHHSVINRITWMQRKYKISSRDIILQKTSYTFDVSVWELFLWLLKGSKLVLLPQDLEKDIDNIIKLIVEQKVTTIHFVPSVFNILLKYLKNSFDDVHKINSLKHIFFSGEVLPKNQVVEFNNLSKNNDTKLHNLYGPTETTVDVSYFDCKNIKNLENIPIGRPIDNTYIYILDKNKKLVDIGQKGELYVSGVGVARGYVNNKALTNKRFISDPYHLGKTMYRTGDIAQWLPDGNILYVDRLDNQIKVSGIRVELGDISQNILKILDIEQCIVRMNNDILVAYYTSKKPLNGNFIRTELSRTLPDYMVPQNFIYLEKIPLNTSGKINYNALPKEALVDNSYNNKTSLTTKERLRNIYRVVLKKDNIRDKCNFFELGGSSLMAMELIYNINSIFNINFPIKLLFRNSSINSVSKIINGLIGRDSVKKISLAKKRKYYKLSDAQRRLWFLYKLNRSSAVYNVTQVTSLKGHLDISNLKKALRVIIDRHYILRSNFIEIKGSPVQIINDKIDIEFTSIDLSNKKSKKIAINNEIKKISQLPFNLEKDSLIRIKLITLSNKSYLLCLSLHHMVCDGWSMFIMNDEIAREYKNTKDGVSSKKELTLQYKDYVEWTYGDEYQKIIKKQEKFWLEEFNQIPDKVFLPVEKNYKPNKYHNVNVLRKTINQNIKQKIDTICRENNCTYFMFLMSCFYLFIGRMSWMNNITIGTPISNRPHNSLRDLIGFFSNTLAVKVDIEDSDNFLNLLNRVKNKLLDVFNNQSYPFDELVKNINPDRASQSNPLFNVMFAYFDKNRDLLKLDGLDSDIYHNDTEKSKFDLTVSVIEGKNDFTIEMKFDSSLYKDDSMKEYLDRFILLINNILKDINSNVYNIDILINSEKKKLLNNQGVRKKMPGDIKLYNFVEKSAKLYPDDIAIKYNDLSITYLEFNRRINKFASFLKNKGVTRKTLVGLSMSKSIELFIAIYAILKTGGAYIPLDPDMPKNRIKELIRDARLRYIVVDKNYSNLSLKNNIQKINIYDRYTVAQIAKQEDVEIKTVSKSKDLAYVIYTSGSTGKPKGVMCSHQGVANTVLAASDIFKITKQDIILQFGNITFDTSVLDMNLAFYNGATLVLASKNEIKDPVLLRKVLLKNKVTFGLFIPTILHYLNISDTKLKCLASGSESISKYLVERLLKRTRFINTYGPTEFSIFCTYWSDKIRKDEYIPIGKPIYNTRIYLLDRFLKPVPVGVLGEIYLSGRGLSIGYLNNINQTNKHFIKDPFNKSTKMYKTGDMAKILPDGNIVFMGRNDNQVNIRGFRVELGDIESNLITHKNIKECVVVVRNYNGDDRLVAYYISNNSINNETLREYLKKRLPIYMIPNYFIFLEKMPHNINGKIDRRKLPELINSRQDTKKDDNELISKIIKAWSKVLGINNIKQNDNFFDLGGHSILVLKVLFYLKSDYKIDLSPKDFYDNPSPDLLVSCISRYDNESTQKDRAKKQSIKRLKPKFLEQNSFKNILITGGTGFFGAYIIKELLEKRGINKIFVIVRSNNTKDAQFKLNKKLSYYFDDLNLEKVVVIPADLTEPSLGMSLSKRDELIKKIDLVIHSAADVKHVGDYSNFYKINVLGTKNILYLVKGNKKIRFCHVSTLSVSGNITGYKKYIFKEDDLDIGQKFDSYYDQSKFEAEKIVRQEIDNGLDGVVFRLGNLVGASDKYKFQKNKETNAFYNYMRSIINTKSDWGINVDFNLTPVDISAKILVYLSYLKNVSGQTIHLFNDNIINSKKLVDIINDLGYKISKNGRVLQVNDAYLPYLNNYLSDKNKTIFLYDNMVFKAYTGSLEFKWPKINKSIVKKIINNINL